MYINSVYKSMSSWWVAKKFLHHGRESLAVGPLAHLSPPDRQEKNNDRLRCSSPRDADVHTHEDIVNPQLVYRHFHNRSLPHPWWYPHVDRVLGLDHALALAGQAQRIPIASRATTVGTAHKHRDAKRHHDAMEGFIRGEPDFDRQTGPLHGFGRLTSRKILEEMGIERVQRRAHGAKVSQQ